MEDDEITVAAPRRVESFPTARGQVILAHMLVTPSARADFSCAASPPHHRRRSLGRTSAHAVITAALTLLVWVSPAFAAKPSALVVFGKADQHAQTIVMNVVDRVLRAAGWPLVPTLAENDAVVVRGCLAKDAPWPCLRSMAEKRGIQQIVAVRVELERLANGTSQIVLTGRLVYAGASSVLEQKRFCGACSDEDLMVYAEEISKTLLDERAVRAGTTQVEVRSTPMGAEVRIDGELVGLTNATFATFPGKHSVEMRLPGHEPETRSVTAIDGKTVTAEVALRVLGAPAPPPPGDEGGGGHSRSALRRYGPMSMVGAGGVLMVVGSVLLVLDEDKQLFDTEEERLRDPHFQNYAPVGVPMLIGGAVIAGAGGYLWWRFASRNTVPVASASAEGATVGLAGSF
ncbi:MAG: PEGA domain-containing protein [Kofleriaceae bacterium]